MAVVSTSKFEPAPAWTIRLSTVLEDVMVGRRRAGGGEPENFALKVGRHRSETFLCVGGSGEAPAAADGTILMYILYWTCHQWPPEMICHPLVEQRPRLGDFTLQQDTAIFTFHTLFSCQSHTMAPSTTTSYSSLFANQSDESHSSPVPGPSFSHLDRSTGSQTS